MSSQSWSSLSPAKVLSAYLVEVEAAAPRQIALSGLILRLFSSTAPYPQLHHFLHATGLVALSPEKGLKECWKWKNFTGDNGECQMGEGSVRHLPFRYFEDINSVLRGITTALVAQHWCCWAHAERQPHEQK